jgi:hypothetical protein
VKQKKNEIITQDTRQSALSASKQKERIKNNLNIIFWMASKSPETQWEQSNLIFGNDNESFHNVKVGIRKLVVKEKLVNMMRI